MSDADREFAVRILLAEYERLKEEQKARIGFRDNLLYVTLASTATVCIATLESSGHGKLLLLLPLSSLLLGWTYLVNDEKISTIGKYINEELQLRLIGLVSNAVEIFQWERYHRAGNLYSGRKRLQLAIDLLAFIGVPIIAIILYTANYSVPALLYVACLVEIAALAQLAVQIVRNSIYSLSSAG